MPVQIFFSCSQSASYMPFRFISVQDFSCLLCKRRVDRQETVCYIFMYRTFAHPKLFCCLSHRCFMFNDIICNLCTRSIASTSKIKSRLTAALVINSFESRPADLVTTVTDHPERTGRYHPYVSESLLRDIRSNHTVLGCLPLLFPQCCR